MSNMNLIEKKWKPWYPGTIKNQLKLNNIDDIKSKNQKDICDQVAYQKGLKQGRIEGYNLKIAQQELEMRNKNIQLYNKMKYFLSEFESAMNVLDTIIANKLLEISLKVSAKVLNNSIQSDKLSILNTIKKMIKHDISCKNIIFKVNPKNKLMIKKYFSNLLKSYNYIILYDNNIEDGSCKIELYNGELDLTAFAKWKELCRIFCLKVCE